MAVTLINDKETAQNYEFHFVFDQKGTLKARG